MAPSLLQKKTLKCMTNFVPGLKESSIKHMAKQMNLRLSIIVSTVSTKSSGHAIFPKSL